MLLCIWSEWVNKTCLNECYNTVELAGDNVRMIYVYICVSVKENYPCMFVPFYIYKFFFFQNLTTNMHALPNDQESYIAHCFWSYDVFFNCLKACSSCLYQFSFALVASIILKCDPFYYRLTLYSRFFNCHFCRPL